ncbi:MAG: YebC/PmpR family DNA-binding transcriptional regulator [Clostridia bacterium]|nr:YebC/PmpR family DNA-binding transcriptional regulator [Clostridia bacterium]
MSGHSKWNNIKRKKGKADAERGHLFTKFSREIAVAVKAGGPNIDGNFQLKNIVAKAKAANIPNDNIMRAIKNAAGSDSTNYDSKVYEGYGVGGVAVIVECLTDNANRTAGDVRHIFDKCGGNMGASGCVSFMFNRQGVLVIDSANVADEEELMMQALDAGAEDFQMEEDMYEITTDPDSFDGVREALANAGYEFESAEVAMVPSTYTTLDDPEMIAKMEKMLDMFDENDDVQNVYHNWDMPEVEDED